MMENVAKVIECEYGFVIVTSAKDVMFYLICWLVFPEARLLPKVLDESA